LLNREFHGWRTELQKMIDEIEKHLKDVSFHKMPGVIGHENFAQWQAFFIYSGVNLLFSSDENKDYAFYLKFPNESNKDIQVNERIESTLRSASIVPIAITGNSEFANWAEIRNSAGVRCLIKVLSRK